MVLLNKLRTFSPLLSTGLILTAVALWIAFALNAGPDMSWDLRNYHFYSGYAALTGIGDQNLWPAQIQSWFNPSLDALVVALMFVLSPKFVAVALVLLQSCSLPLLYLLARRTLPDMHLKPLAILSIFIGGTGPMVLDQLGTGYGDILTAIPILAALALLAHAIRASMPNTNYLKYVAVVGFILGLSCGLKPTNFMYAPGMAFIILFADGHRLILFKKRIASSLGILIGTSILGLLVADGGWAWHLWQQTGNPAFPFLNSVFHSPLLPATTQTLDQRFTPHTLKDFLEFPFKAALGLSPGSLVSYQDPRFAVLIALLAIVILRRRPQARWLSLLLGFFFITYILWLFIFGVERYIVGLELLSGILITSLLSILVGSRAAFPVTAIAALVIFGLTVIPPKKFSGERGDWENVGYNGNWLKVSIPDEAATEPALYLLMGDAPLSFIIPFFPIDATFIGMNGNLMTYASSFMEIKKHQVIDEYPGKIFAIGNGRLTQEDQAYLQTYGLSTDQSCTWIFSVTNYMQICPLHK